MTKLSPRAEEWRNIYKIEVIQRKGGRRALTRPVWAAIEQAAIARAQLEEAAAHGLSAYAESDELLWKQIASAEKILGVTLSGAAA